MTLLVISLLWAECLTGDLRCALLHTRLHAWHRQTERRCTPTQAPVNYRETETEVHINGTHLTLQLPVFKRQGTKGKEPRRGLHCSFGDGEECCARPHLGMMCQMGGGWAMEPRGGGGREGRERGGGGLTADKQSQQRELEEGDI